jgi:hypothetical protein
MVRISQLDAARQQLDCAIGLLDTEDLAAHSLAWAAFNLLHETLGNEATKEEVRKLKKTLKLGKVPAFFRHAGEPNAFLPEHSADTAYLTIALAIRLWQEHGQQPTDTMRAFGKRPNPYEPGYRHREIVEAARHGPVSELRKGLTKPST